MSRLNTTANDGAPAASALHRARQAGAQVKPLATSTRAAAGHGLHRARAWAAPQVDRTAKAVQDKVAPQVSAMLSSAAQRIEPAKPQRRRWRKLAGISILTAAASALAALARSRAKPGRAPAAEADPEDVAPTAQMRDGNPGNSTSTDADVDGQVRTS
jgi:hypothetical protein